MMGREMEVCLFNFFLLFVVSFQARASKPCQNVLPGISRLRKSVDITKLDVLPMNIAVDDGFRKPILDFTCDENTEIIVDAMKYSIPDQVWHESNIPSGFINADVKIYKSHYDIKKGWAARANVDVLNGMFSASSSFNRLQKSLTNSPDYIEEVTSFFSSRKVDLVPFWMLPLSRVAKAYIDRYLPKTLKENPRRYKHFIRIFGTHYSSSGTFGGLIQLLLHTKKQYFQSVSDNTVKVQAKAMFLDLVGLSGEGSSQKTKIDANFVSSTTKTIRYFGGKTNLLSKSNGLPSWQSTISRNPWLFAVSLEPIYDFIDDQQKAAAMKIAVQAHLDHAYLREFLELLEIVWKRDEIDNASYNKFAATVKTYLSQNFPDHLKTSGLDTELQNEIQKYKKNRNKQAYIRKFLQKLEVVWKKDEINSASYNRLKATAERYLTQSTPDDSKINSLDRELQQEIQKHKKYKYNHVVPNWFKHSVKLCFRWYADGDGGQCGGGVGRQLCAKPNSWTAYYRDDTDRRSGGCVMRWAVTAAGVVPDWFRQVNICYSWRKEGDGQCDGSRTTTCANIGSYTAYYRDDTDSRSGGCRMRWKLKVPSSAPTWMKKARLCFDWYPDDRGKGQCGGWAARRLCASANSYTSFYRDDTDNRAGGCRMRWGIML